MMYGTKCGFKEGRFFKPETLGSLYQELIQEHGEVNVNRPRPGMVFKKRYNPLTDVDKPTFRRMPSEIHIISPERLYRSYGWKYKGTVHLECEAHWHFQYKYKAPVPEDPFKHNQHICWTHNVPPYCRIERVNHELCREPRFSRGWLYEDMAVSFLTTCYVPAVTNHLTFQKGISPIFWRDPIQLQLQF